MSNQLNLTADQIQHINLLTSNGQQNYYLAYGYISDLIANNPNVDSSTKTWFERAYEINSNDLNSAANIFIRGVTNEGLSWDGLTADPDQISNDIGSHVIEQINLDGGIPQLSIIVGKDISVAIDDSHMTLGGWGGSFYYWDLPITRDGVTKTVGEFILSSPAEVEKFIAVNAAAMAQTIAEEHNGPDGKAEYWEIVLFGVNSTLPTSIKAEIFDRAVSGIETGNYGGNPNYISSFVSDDYGVPAANGWFHDASGWYTIGDFGTRINATSSESAILNNVREVRFDHQYEYDVDTYDTPDVSVGIDDDGNILFDLGSDFEDAPVNSYITSNGEVVLQQDGHFRQSDNFQFWMDGGVFQSGKELTEISANPFYHFTNDISAFQNGADDVLARYDFMDGFASAWSGQGFTNSYLSGDSWDAIINLGPDSVLGPFGGLLSQDFLLGDTLPGQVLSGDFNFNDNYNTGFAMADAANDNARLERVAA